MVEHGSVQPDGRPTYKGTPCDMLMSASPLLVHVLSMRQVEECVTSTKGTGVPYICRGSQMAHAGNNVLIVYDRIAHN